MAEIQRNVIDQGKRNVISRHFHAKNDKEKIAGWKLDLNRILLVFNVRSMISVLRQALTRYSQTELVINTHTTVSETHAIVSEIHRTVVGGQESNDSRNLPVSDTRTPSIIE